MTTIIGMSTRERNRLGGPLRLVAAILLSLGLLALPNVPAHADSAPFTYCYSTNNQNCVTQWGYTGQNTWGYPVDDYRNNCTNYAAFRLNQNGYLNPDGLGNASSWATNARGKGLQVTSGAGNHIPNVGDVAQWNYGHVAYVEWVSADRTQFAISETGWGPTTIGGVTYPSMSGRGIFGGGGRHNESVWPDNFIHFNGGPTTPPVTDLSPPPGFTRAASEGDNLTLKQRSDVAFGANGVFNVRRGITGTIGCTVAAFGDPLVGISKACFVLVLTPPPGFTYAAPEAMDITLAQRSDVAFGANGAFNIKRGLTGTISCSVAAFGDPGVGVRKSCYLLALTPPAGFTYAATEGANVTLPRRSDVAFGANGAFKYRLGFTGTSGCTVAAFGDPLPGVQKSCFVREALLQIVPGTPTLSGTAQVGHILTAKTGTWAPAGVTFRYQWLRNGDAIAGATAATYALVGADKGTKLSVRVAGSKTDYKTATSTSSATRTVAAGTLHKVTPKISGTRRVGHTLTAKPGAWGPSGVVLTYQWYRNGHKVTGATAATYLLSRADKGKKLKVKVTGTLAGWTSSSRTSTQTRKVRG